MLNVAIVRKWTAQQWPFFPNMNQHVSWHTGYAAGRGCTGYYSERFWSEHWFSKGHILAENIMGRNWIPFILKITCSIGSRISFINLEFDSLPNWQSNAELITGGNKENSYFTAISKTWHAEKKPKKKKKSLTDYQKKNRLTEQKNFHAYITGLSLTHTHTHTKYYCN